jgi:hypothetical protein
MRSVRVRSFVPSGNILTMPFQICLPHPQAELAAEESVTKEFRERVSCRPFTTKGWFISQRQYEPFP